jgi:hypothetical protein
VGGPETRGDLAGQLEGLVDWQLSAGDARRQGLALGQLHDQEAPPVVLLEAVEGGDVLVAEGCLEPGLALEAGQAIRVRGHLLRQQLERHLPAEALIAGAVHLAHAAVAEQGEHAVMAQRLTDELRQVDDPVATIIAWVLRGRRHGG